VTEFFSKSDATFTPKANNTLAVKLTSARKAKSWSVTKAATECKYSSQQWRNFESGSSTPQLQRLPNICRSLNLSLSETLGAWAAASLPSPECEEIVTLFTNWDSTSRRANNFADIITKGLAELPRYTADELTVAFVLDAAKLLISYRERLFLPTERKENRTYNAFDALQWRSADQGGRIQQWVVSRSRQGAGFIAELVRIPPGYGGFHKHVEGPNIGGGREFFAVLSGTYCLGVFEHEDFQWKEQKLTRASVGVYPGRKGHAFINMSNDDVILYVVGVPLPPPLAEHHGIPPRDRGWAKGVEFELQKFRKAGLPHDLVQRLDQIIPDPNATAWTWEI